MFILNKKSIIFTSLILFLAAGYFMLNRPLSEGTVLMTQIAAKEDLSFLKKNHIARSEFPSSIVAFSPERPGSSPSVLTKTLYSAHSPDLSSDDKQLVFTGRLNPDSNRQIWLMNLKSKRYQALTDESKNCFDPFFLPTGKIAYSCDWQSDLYGFGSILFRYDPVSGDSKRMTFHPHADHSGSVLHDGRIMWVSQQIYPEKNHPDLMAIRPDGTNANLFYRLPDGYQIKGKARENEHKQIYFIANSEEPEGGSVLFRFSYINPITSTQKIYKSDEGSLFSIYPQVDGQLLASYQSSASESAGLFKMHEDESSPIELLKDDRYHFLEPIVLNKQPFLPKVLPSALDDSKETGLIVFTDPSRNIEKRESHNIIQVNGLDGLYKEFLTAKDGSFYIITTAQTPIRFRQLNEDGELVNGPTPWVWVMNGDRRGFTGWDPLQNIAPANLVPQAINEPAIRIVAPGPVDLQFMIDMNHTSEVIHEN